MRFASPWFLLLLLIPLGYLFIRYLYPKLFKKNIPPLQGNLTVSSTLLYAGKPGPWWVRYRAWISDGLICLSMVLLILALARPMGGHSITQDRFFGIDIVLTIDVSGTMLNVDNIPANMPRQNHLGQIVFFDPAKTLLSQNRLGLAKKVIGEYVEKQANNRIGVVVFGGYSYTRCPLTHDRVMLGKILSEIQYNPENDGTAIGMGIATAVNRLKNSSAKSKVIILLTDGNNNRGLIDPLSAASIASEMGIRVYTIGLGRNSGILTPASLNFTEYILQQEVGDVGINESILNQIAEKTGGRYYRALDGNMLGKIYDDIDHLEKSKIDVKRRVLYRENFYGFLLAGFLVLALWIALSAAFPKIP